MGAIKKHIVKSFSKPFTFHKFVSHAISFVIGLSLGILITLQLKSSPLVVFQPSSLVSINTSLIPLPPPPHQPPLTSDSTNNTSNSSGGTISLEGDESMVMHNMSDQVLLLRASSTRVPILVQESGRRRPKIAFMFLTGGPLPLAPLWDNFFKGNKGLYTIYVHSHPNYNETIPQTSVFYGRRIPSQPVYWGTTSMIDAERRLLANALLDVSNQRFVLLSDSCIPLFNFIKTYDYLIASNLSFVSVFDDPVVTGRGRYDPQMQPVINFTDWRKGSQWFEMHRELALRVVSDTTYYSMFRRHCQPPCYGDEHYIPTFVNMLYGESNSNRGVTWVNFSRGGPHPRQFDSFEIGEGLLNELRNGSECMYNGNITSMCFLFARKFSPDTLKPLLMLLDFDK